MGFFTLDREILNHPLWLEEPFTKGQAWVDLIGLANHKDTRLMVRGKFVDAKRGDVNRSFRWLAKRWQWSPHKVARFIKLLEAEQMATHKTAQGETVVTICNYSYWQEKYLRDGTQNDTQNGTRTAHPRHTNNNVNNSNNILKQSSYAQSAAKKEEDEKWLEELQKKVSLRLSR